MRSTSKIRLALVILAALGAFVAFWRLSTPGWGVDEVVYAEAADAYGRGDFSLNRGHAWLSKELIAVSTALLGDGELGVRLPGAIAAFLTGFVVWALARRVGGEVAGLAAAGVWWLLPQAPGVHLIRLDRYGMLEPPMVLFGSLALYAAWRWGESGRVVWALAAGASLGLSVSSKFTGALWAPAVALPLLWVPLSWPGRLKQGLVAVAVGAGALVAPYLVAGTDGVGALAEGARLQFANNSQGHLQIVAGTLYTDPPWWSHMWWQAQYLGWLATGVFWVLALGGFASPGRERGQRWRTRAFLAAALLFPVLSLVVSPRKLPHYHLVLVPVIAVLVGLALASLAQARRARPLALLAAAVLVVTAAAQVVRVATVQPDAYRLAAAQLQEAGVGDGQVLVFGWADVLGAEMPDARAVHVPPPAPPEAIVVDPVTRDRFRGSEVDRYVSSVAPGYDRSRAGRLTVYVRSDL